MPPVVHQTERILCERFLLKAHLLVKHHLEKAGEANEVEAAAAAKASEKEADEAQNADKGEWVLRLPPPLLLCVVM